ncbi:MAG TPA: autotransporter-associated beta strand repeat-containing protein [bacterium]|nr:autotransporter-associated beta strand repeat-containing protein [bacterium]
MKTFRILIGMGVMLIGFVLSADAVEKTWDGGSNVDGNWQTPANWLGDTKPGGGEDLLFAGTARLTNSNDYAAGTSFGLITFNPASGNVSISGNAITLTGGMTNSAGTNAFGINTTLSSAEQFNIATSTQLTLSGAMSGASGGITKTGAGTLVLSGSNSYVGGTTVSDGTLVGTTSLASIQGPVVNNATVKFDIATSGTYAGNMSGTGAMIKANSNTLILTGTNNFSGGTTVAGGALSGTATSLQGNITANAGTSVTFDQASAGTYAGSMSGSGALTKAGSSALVLSGSQTYAGATNINAGTIKLNAADIMSDASVVSLNSDTAVLDLNGNSDTIGALSSGGYYSSKVLLGGNGTLAFGANNGGYNYYGTISGIGGITKIGTGYMYYYGNTGFTNSGPTQIKGGGIQFYNNSANSLGDMSAVTIDPGAAVYITYSDTIGSLAGGGDIYLNNGTFHYTSGGAPLTTGGDNSSTTFSGRILNWYGTYYPGALTKVGLGTMTITGSNGYTGATTVNGGTLQAGAANVLSDSTGVNVADGAVYDMNSFNDTISYIQGLGTINLGTATLTTGSGNSTFNGNVTGAGSLNKYSSGTLRLDGFNSYTGGTTINGGVLSITTTSILGNITDNANLTIDQTVYGELASIISGTGSLTKAGIGMVKLTGSNSYTGGTSISGGTLAGTPSTIKGNVSTSSGTALMFDMDTDANYGNVISGYADFIKQGTATINMNSAQTYYGATKVNGGTMVLGGASGTNVYTTSVVIGNGELKLDNSSANLGDRLTNTAPVTLKPGGILEYIGYNNAASTETIGPVTIDGASTIKIVSSGSGSATLTGTGALTRTSGMVNFVGTDLGNAQKMLFTTSPVSQLDDGILPYATINGSEFATYGANGIAVYNGVNLKTMIGTSGPQDSVKKTSGETLSANNAINALMVNNNSTIDDSDNTHTLTINSGLVSSTGGSNVVSVNTLAFGSAEAKINVGSATDLTIGSVITGSAGLTKAGDGLLLLNGLNTYTGGATIAGGTLKGAASSISGNINDNAQLIFDQGTDGTYAGFIMGSGNVAKEGVGTLVMSAANTYAGETKVSQGTLALGAINAAGGTTSVVVLNGAVLQLAAGNTIGDTASVNVSSGAVMLLTSGNSPLDTTGNDRIGSLSGAGSVVLGTGSAGAYLETGFNGGNTTFSGTMSGAGGLTKLGNGTMTLSSSNSYSGGTTVSAGTLKSTAAEALGSGDLTISASVVDIGANNEGINKLYLTNFGKLLGSGVVTGAGFEVQSGRIETGLAGAGALNKTSDGTVTMTGSNSYSGGTTVSAGTLIGTTASLQKNITNNADVTFDQASTGSYSGNISGSGMVEKTGWGTVALTGVNSYAGVTKLTQGTLIGNTASLPGNVIDNATLVFDQASAGTFAGAISGAGSFVKNGSGLLALTGSNSYAGDTTVNAGTMKLQSANSVADSNLNMLTVNSGGTLDMNNNSKMFGAMSGTGIVNLGSGTITTGGSGANTTFGGAISGTGGIVKRGLGLMEITGSNSFTGMTSITEGKLKVTGTMASDVTVNDTATLTGSGKVDEVIVNRGGILAPGNSPGTITTGSETWNAGGIYKWELNDSDIAGGQGNNPGWDWVNMLGSLTINSDSVTPFVIDITSLNGSNPGLVPDFSNANDYNWIIASATGGISGFAANKFSLSTANFQNPLNGNFALAQAGNDLRLSYYSNVVRRVWNGNAGTGNTSWTTAANWDVMPTTGQNVKFGTGGSIATLNSDWTCGNVTFERGAGFTLEGSGTLTINGGMFLNDNNTYVMNAPVKLGADQTWNIAAGTGVLSVNGTVNNNGKTLTVSTSGTADINSVISGTGGLNKDGSGVMLLGNTNAYTGPTTVYLGTLAYETDNAIYNGPVTVDGGVLDIAGFNDAVGTVTLNNGSIVGSGGTLTGSSYAVKNGTISANLGGSGVVLTKSGSGTVTLAGNNSYTGGTAINDGTLIASSANIPGYVSNSATLMFNQNATGTFASSIVGTGSLVKAGSGLLTLSGVNMYSGNTSVEAGTLKLGSANGMPNSTASAVTVAGGALLDLNNNSRTFGSIAGAGNIALGNATLTTGGSNASTTYGGVMSGTGGLTKSGSGTMVMAGTSTYTGATAVNAGKLAVDGSIVSAVTLNGGGTLGGAGRVGTVTIQNGGILSPGNSPGTLTSGAQTWNSGGHYLWEINDVNAAKGIGYDWANILGSLTIGATTGTPFSIDITSLAQNNARGEVYNFDNMKDYSWVIASVSPGSSISGYADNKFTLNADNFDNDLGGGTFLLSKGGLDMRLSFISGIRSVWDGSAGPSNTNWSEATNWVDNAVPLIGANIKLATGGSVVTLDADRRGGSVLNDAGASFSVVQEGAETNALTIDRGIFVQDGQQYNFSVPIVLGDEQTWNNLDTDGVLKVDGPVNTSGNNLTISTTGTTELNGVISNTGGLYKDGSGELKIAGSNTYTGGTFIQAGTLSTQASDLMPGDVTVDGGTFNIGDNDESVDTLALISGSVIGGTGELIADQYQVTSGIISATLSGAGTLTKTGAGTVVVNGDQLYVGATTVDEGILKIAGSIDSDVTVWAGGVISSDALGQVGKLTINEDGAIAPGNSPGTLEALDTIWNAGGDYFWEINNAAGTEGAVSGWDLLDITGTLTINATTDNTFLIDVASLTALNQPGDAANFDFANDYVWTIARASNGISGFNTNKFVLNLDDFTNEIGAGSFYLAKDGNNLNIVFDGIGGGGEVPEPSTLLLLLPLLGFGLRKFWSSRRTGKGKVA